MIDCHAHLEANEFDNDRNKVIDRCKKAGLKAIITCCAAPRDFDFTLNLVKKYPNFVFATVSIHPEYVEEVTDKKKKDFFKLIRENKGSFQAIGETGLDFWYVKEPKWRDQQKELFVDHIHLSNELKKPLVIHSRDAFEDCINILEKQECKNVLMHMFGAHHLMSKIVDNNWFVSMNTIVLKSKKHRKIARDIPLENLLLETDSPWLAPKQILEGVKARNDPTSVAVVAEKIAEIKKIPKEDVASATTKNAIKFFGLPLK